MRDISRMTQRQRDWYFRRPRPSTLMHPFLQDLRSPYEWDQESERRRNQNKGRCPMTGDYDD